MENNYISTTEAAKLLGISRVAVFKKIKKGEIEAMKIGRNYIIDKRSLGPVYQDMTPASEAKIDQAVERFVKEHKDVLKKLGTE